MIITFLTSITLYSLFFNFISICTDTAVSFAIKKGLLYSWGMGSNNQLGKKDDDDQLVPNIVAGKNIKDRLHIIIFVKYFMSMFYSMPIFNLEQYNTLIILN